MMLKSKWWLACAVAATASITAAGCSSSGSSGTGGGSASTSTSASGTYPVTAGVLHAFTGQNAFFGLNAENACKAAALQINAAGGIMGHPMNCTAFDTKGDPADAVPVTQRMLVSAPHLVMVIGPDGSDIPSVLPVLQQAKQPEMNTVGD
ncbi:MAG TPA: ABC transporter substrate-binding protein, partial [Trebonia sp.]|nr:ABC transporter substrate-binding protein [Trebonia sp.]